MLLNADVDIKKSDSNPTITLSELVVSKENIEFPDPNGYFILSDAGKLYTVVSNKTVLLNPSKGYYVSPFRIDYANPQIIDLAKSIFENCTPISGLAKKALDITIERIGKNKASLPNRL